MQRPVVHEFRVAVGQCRQCHRRVQGRLLRDRFGLAVTRGWLVHAVHRAARMLGADYAGVLQRDGWAPYRQFVHAAHQTCLAHLLRRCRTMMLDYPHHPFAPQVDHPLRAALATRERHAAGTVSDHGLAVARGRM